jgi:hypothetical protein
MAAGVCQRNRANQVRLAEQLGKGDTDMTKAKARLRAKAKAAQKAKKREAGANQPDQKVRPGHFDPGAHSIKAPVVNAHANNFAGAKRGSARSK